MIQVKNAYTGRGLSRPCYPLKNPHVSFPKRWTLDLLDPSQGPWLNLPKLKRWKARNDHVFEKVADAKLFHAFHDLSCISASPITSVTRAASPVMPFGSFRILSVSLCEASCLTIKERYSKIDCQWGRNCRTDGPELTAASETRRSTSKYILSRPRTTLLDMVRYGSIRLLA